ncbi:MAG: hypothetical protein Q4D15_02405 [Lachnospiraceae bacterium]|nr:hypothetical protein [Lachnospiraceae bacterium]
MNKKSRRNRIILAALAAVLIALYIVGALFGLHSGGIYTNRTDIRDLNEGRSQILVTGKNYTLENEQEEKYLEEQRKKQEEQQTVPDPDKNQIKEVADSIVTEDLMEQAEQMDEPDQEPEKDPNGQQGSNQQGQAGGPDSGDGNQATHDEGGSGTGGGSGQGEGGGGSNTNPEPVNPPEINKTPIIESNIGSEEYWSNVAYVIRGTDYKGHVIDGFYYSVWFDGVLQYSAGVDGSGWVTYRADNQVAGYHEITATIKDTEGNTASKTWTIYVSVEAEVPVNQYATLEVEARTIGYGYVLSATEQIYKDESAANFVARVLRAYGFEPSMDGSSYLYRIWGINAGEANVPEPIKTHIEQTTGELYGVTNPGALGERDYTANSGWVYLYNGWYQGVGLYGVTLTDGDVIHLGFTLWGGAEYDGTWGTLGSW